MKRKLLSLASLSLLAGCGYSGPADPGEPYFCLIPAAQNTPLGMKGGKLAIGDEHCAKLGTPQADKQKECATECAARNLQNCGQVQAVMARDRALSVYTMVWDYDLQHGNNRCPGFVVGPGVPACHGRLDGNLCLPTFDDHGNCTSAWVNNNTCAGLPDVFYTCLYPETNLTTCDVGALHAPLSVFPGYQAGMGAASVGQFSAEGHSVTPHSRPGESSLRFNLSGGQNGAPAVMALDSLLIPLDDIPVPGNTLHKGTVSLVGAGVTATRAAPGAYDIPANAAELAITGTWDNGSAAIVTVHNSDPLRIAMESAGPRIVGALDGTIDGHAFHADINAVGLWINRPPAAVAKATNVTYDSSMSPNAHVVQESCFDGAGVLQWQWFGDPSFRPTVKLDAGGSFDPDPEDSLIYSWNGQPFGTQPVAGLAQGPGTYKAALTVQDQFHTSAVTSVTYTVKDLARPARPSQCGTKIALFRPTDILRFRPLADPVPFEISRTTVASSGLGFVLQDAHEGLIRSLGEEVMRGLGRRVVSAAGQPELGVQDVRLEQVDDVFTTEAAAVNLPAAPAAPWVDAVRFHMTRTGPNSASVSPEALATIQTGQVVDIAGPLGEVEMFAPTDTARAAGVVELDGDEEAIDALFNAIGMATVRDFGDAEAQGYPLDSASASGDVCASATVIPPTGGRFEGTTAGLQGDYSGSCASSSSSDAVYTVRLDTRRRVRVTTEGSAFDTVVHVWSGPSCLSQQVMCDDDTYSSSGQYVGLFSTTEAVLEPGDYWVVVDGYGGGSAGHYALDVEIGDP